MSAPRPRRQRASFGEQGGPKESVGYRHPMPEETTDSLSPAPAWQPMLANKPELARATATGIWADWFEVSCPSCGELTLVSLYARDGSMCDCDACPTGQFWFYAGDFAEQRRRD